MNKGISRPGLVAFSSPDWQDYELVDSGAGKKLERFGPYTLIRPEPLAPWSRALSRQVWDRAHATYHEKRQGSQGRWKFRHLIESPWEMCYKDLRFQVQVGKSRHVGVFPEHAVQWDWIARRIKVVGSIRVLTLFSYTGLATLAAAAAGAQVTHVDASRGAVVMARQNQVLSGLEDCPVRWIVEDAVKFVRRQVRRGSKYDAIVLDPPKFGRGPKGQVWEFFKSFPLLCELCRDLVSDQPQFILLTAYAKRASVPELRDLIAHMMSDHNGHIVTGQLVTRPRNGGHELPHSLIIRWSANR